MNFNYLYFLILFIYSPDIFGQTITDAQAGWNNVQEIGGTDVNNVVQVFDNRYSGVKGSPYLYEDWLSGSIFYLQGEDSVVYEGQIKLDIFNNQVLLKNPSTEVVYTLQRDRIFAFTLQDTLGLVHVFIPKKMLKLDKERDYNIYSEPWYSNIKGKYVEIWFQGKKNILFTDHEITLNRADYQGGFNAGHDYDEFITNSKLYMLQENVLEKVKVKEKSILKILSDKKNELESFIETESLVINTENDIVKLLEFYETL